MDPEKAKLISSLIDKIPIVIPIVFTSAISIVTLIVSYKTRRRQSSLKLITARRIKWQETVRNELAEFLKDAHLLYGSLYDQLKNDPQNVKSDLPAISKTVAIGYKLILRLNPIDDAEIIVIIKDISDFHLPKRSDEVESYYKKINTLLADLFDKSHDMLKNEWEKIKLEAV